MIALPPVDTPGYHVNPIFVSLVSAPLFARKSGLVGSSTAVAPFPLVDYSPSP